IEKAVINGKGIREVMLGGWRDVEIQNTVVDNSNIQTLITKIGVIKVIGQAKLALFQQRVVFLCSLKHLFQLLGSVCITFLTRQRFPGLVDTALCFLCSGMER